MIQRDYILRMIEQFFAIIRRVLRHRETQQYEKALDAIRAAYKAFLGCDEKFIDSHSADDLVGMMNDRILQPEQVVMAAKLLAEHAETLEVLEALDEAARLRCKSLALYLEVFLGAGAPTLESCFEDIDRLAESLRPVGIPLDSAARLPFYLERRNRLAEAEDALFLAADAAPAGHGVFAEGTSFYKRLMSRPAAELEAGGLPLAEVEEGRTAFEAVATRKRGVPRSSKGSRVT